MVGGQEPKGLRAGLGPRGLALIGLVAGVAGFAVALLPAITGSGGFAGAYVALISFVDLTIVGVIVVAVGAVVALLTNRHTGIALMLGPAMFLVGYEAGYFVMVNSLYYR